jgi:hypothetical protein
MNHPASFPRGARVLIGRKRKGIVAPDMSQTTRARAPLINTSIQDFEDNLTASETAVKSPIC